VRHVKYSLSLGEHGVDHLVEEALRRLAQELRVRVQRLVSVSRSRRVTRRTRCLPRVRGVITDISDTPFT
jgi:hypothetical protein